MGKIHYTFKRNGVIIREEDIDEEDAPAHDRTATTKDGVTMRVARVEMDASQHEGRILGGITHLYGADGELLMTGPQLSLG